MPRIRMLTSVATRTHWWDYDNEYDVTPEEAAAWVGDGLAEYVTEQIETPERRTRLMERRGARKR